MVCADMPEIPSEFHRAVLDDHETATVVYEAVRDPPSGDIVDFRWVYANKAAENILAHRIDHLAGRRVREMLFGDLGERVYRVNRRVIESGEPAESVVKFAHIGRDAVFAIRSAKHGDYVITAYRDVTEKVNADKKLLEFATRLEVATRAADIGVWERDFETGNSYWDAQARRIHGLPQSDDEEIDSKHVDSLLHPDDLARIQGKVRVMGATGVIESRHRVIHPSGEERWVQIVARNVTDHRGKRLVGVCWDVTSEMRAEEELKSKARELELAAERLSIATEVADVGVWEFDFVTQKFFWNDEMFNILGMERQGFDGEFASWRERLHPEDASPVKDAMTRMLRTGRDISMRHRIVRPTGEIRHVRSYGRLVGGLENGRIIGSVLDITPHVLASEELERKTREAQAASEAKSRFLAAMSHEIRTPMNGVLGMSQALAMTEVTDRQREMIDLIVRSGESLLSLLNDILDIARVEAGAMTIGADAFHLGDLVRDVGALFLARAEGRGVDFSVVVAPEADGSVTGDDLRVRQILNNLVSNAIKFTEAGSVKVRVARDSASGEIVITVTDTGVGIAVDQIERIFEAFVQADDSNTRKFGGTGLGLSIVRRLAEAMGGSAIAQSELGAGSTFTVRLPLEVADAPAPVEAPKPALQETSRRCRALVAEDNPTNRRVIEAILGSAGVELTLAVNGREALTAWEEGPYDVILMDIAMPVMDGVETATAIRARERETGRARTPIVAVTANVMPHQIERYLQVGMDSHVPKPIDCGELIQAVLDATLDQGRRRIQA
jgi:PAS domain S-box-containing protein